jgi:hypothetical protein
MASAQDSVPVLISRFELWWLTLSIWLGGVFILTVVPVLLVPRFGVPFGMGGSYLLFFLAWQPVQVIAQRVHGTGPTLVRTLALVVTGALLAYYLRNVLLVAPA